MPKIRVLVVDDAVVVRQLVSSVLNHDPDLEVVGVAANGRIALTKIPMVNPDAVILDVEMPEMGGLETLMAIRASYPNLPVIMFSALTERGAVTTLDALALGANDYVAKPTGVRDLAASQEHIRAELIPKIKAFCAKQIDRPDVIVKRPVSPPLVRTTRQHHHRIDVVALGVSTGGPNALAALIPTIPADFPVPIVIVQHMPPVFTKSLANRLASLSAIDVYEGAEGETLRPGAAWIAPGDYHMVLTRELSAVQIGTHQEPRENSCRPAVDVLFRSVAKVYGCHTLAVILTGMGNDGLQGCRHILEADGQIIVQDEASSVVWGMPGAVTKAGLAEKVLPLDQIGSEIIRRVQRDRAPSKVA